VCGVAMFDQRGDCENLTCTKDFAYTLEVCVF